MPTESDVERVEVHLEELGQRSWLKAAANTLLGTSGSAQFRFAARQAAGEAPAGTDAGLDRAARVEDPVLLGATFPVMRWQDLNDQTTPNAWLDTAQARLDELDDELVQRGWRRSSDTGRHWWSRRYVRPRPVPGDSS